ncbi:MAG: hypothetical protein IPK04_22180 [Bdellovibrionales bacterium]|nr:hypothetical protein [Bdellovibrionales bacterium]
MSYLFEAIKYIAYLVESTLGFRIVSKEAVFSKNQLTNQAVDRVAGGARLKVR